MEEVIQLKAQFHQKENEWKKEKAILSQKIELQDLQIKELKTREENYKKFNDTILSAYNSLDQNKQTVSHTLNNTLDLDSYSRELLEQKHKNSDSLGQLDAENRELKSQLQFQQLKIKDVTARYEKEILTLEHTIELNSQKTNQQFIQKYEYQLEEQQLQLQHLTEQTLGVFLIIKTIKLKAQIDLEWEQKLNDMETSHTQTLHYFQDLYQREREELVERLNFVQDNNLEKTIRIQQKPQRQGLCEITNMQLEMQDIQNKENICQQAYMSFKSSPQKSEQIVEPNSFKGFIVTAKIRQVPKKQTFENQLSYESTQNIIYLGDQQSIQSREKTRSSENLQNTSQVLTRKNQLSVSQISNISQLNCKNSNVMEINSQQLLQLNETSLNVSSIHNHTRTNSKHMGQTKNRDLTMSYDKSLTNFTRQLNQARSIENFTQIIHNDNSAQRTKRYAGSLSGYYVKKIQNRSNL